MILPLNCSTEDLITSTVDGNYTYLAYASDDSGSDFNTTYSSSTHTYGAIITSDVEIANPSVSDFTGKWVPLQKQYTYYAFATDASGTGFTTTHTGSETYAAIINSDVEISTLQASDFSGKWFPLQYNFNYTYVAYADDINGTTGFTTTYSIDKEYFAILVTNEEKTPIYTDFTGLWRKQVPEFKAFNEYVPSFFDTNELGNHRYHIMSERTFNPVCYYHKGTYRRFYFVFFETAQDAAGNRRSGFENKTWVSYYDIDTGTFGDAVSIPETYPLPGGSEEAAPHNLPAIIVANDGSILVFKEDLDFTGSSGVHNSHIEVWKTSTPEDITTFAKITELGDWATERAFAYPNPFKLTNGTIVLTFRDKGGLVSDGNEKYQSLMMSSDNGSTWTNASGGSSVQTIYAQMTNNSGEDWFLYGIHASEKDGINIVLSPQNALEDASGKYIYFLHSDDGVNWKNARQFVEGSGGYTHNIVSAGTITNTLLTSNYLVDSLTPTGDSLSIIVQSANVDRNGIPYIVAGYNDRSGSAKYNNMDNVYVYYYSTIIHGWVKTDILPNMIISGNPEFDAVPRHRSTIIPYENGKYDILTPVMDKDNTEFEADTVISSGTLKAGLYYKVVTTTANNFGTGIVAGDIIRSTGTETCDASNTVILMKAKPYRFRTDNYGVDFQPLNLDESGYKYGGFGLFPLNTNCIIDGRLLLFYPVYETTGGNEVEYQNLKVWYSDINR